MTHIVLVVRGYCRANHPWVMYVVVTDGRAVSLILAVVLVHGQWARYVQVRPAGSMGSCSWAPPVFFSFSSRSDTHIVLVSCDRLL